MWAANSARRRSQTLAPTSPTSTSLKTAGSSGKLKANFLKRPAVAGPLTTNLSPLEKAMVILRFKIRSKPDKNDELMSALAEIITPARATNGVINFDIARDLLDPDSFIATAIYDDGAALELQESL